MIFYLSFYLCFIKIVNMHFILLDKLIINKSFLEQYISTLYLEINCNHSCNQIALK